MDTRLDTAAASAAGKPLCPNCGHRRMRISARVTAHYEIGHDPQLDDLIVLSESLDEADWDEQTGVHCPSCNWSGQLGALGPRQP